MFRSIVAAVVRALKAIAGFARRVAAAPFLALANPFGGGGDVPAVPEVAPTMAEDEAEAGPDMDKVYKELANIVMAWAANSIVDGQPGPLPPHPRLPRSLAEWLRGIELDEAHAIINASENEVSAHLRSRELIPGVRSVRPLEPATWPEKPQFACDQGSPSFVSYAAGYAPAR